MPRLYAQTLDQDTRTAAARVCLHPEVIDKHTPKILALTISDWILLGNGNISTVSSDILVTSDNGTISDYENLPNEILKMVFESLPIVDRMHLAICNKTLASKAKAWNVLTVDPLLDKDELEIRIAPEDKKLTAYHPHGQNVNRLARKTHTDDMLFSLTLCATSRVMIDQTFDFSSARPRDHTTGLRSPLLNLDWSCIWCGWKGREDGFTNICDSLAFQRHLAAEARSRGMCVTKGIIKAMYVRCILVWSAQLKQDGTDAQGRAVGGNHRILQEWFEYKLQTVVAGARKPPHINGFPAPAS